MYVRNDMEKITNATVISRAAVADKSIPKNRFDGLLKQHLTETAGLFDLFRGLCVVPIFSMWRVMCRGASAAWTKIELLSSRLIAKV